MTCVSKVQRKPLVYIASPYTKGDPVMNTHFQMTVFDRMLSDRVVVPFIPLWSHYQHGVFPRHYEDWITYDNEFIVAAGFKYCIRLNAYLPNPGYFEARSSGADNEVSLFQNLGVSCIVQEPEDRDWETILEQLYEHVRSN